MDKDAFRSTVKKWIKQLDLSTIIQQAKPKLAEEQKKKTPWLGSKVMFIEPMINGDRCSGPTNQDSECLAMMVSQTSWGSKMNVTRAVTFWGLLSLVEEAWWFGLVFGLRDTAL